MSSGFAKKVEKVEEGRSAAASSDLSKRKPHLVPRGISMGGFVRHTLILKPEFCVVGEQPLLAGQHKPLAALLPGIGNGPAEQLPCIAVPAVLRQRVDAEDHLPRALLVVQGGVLVHHIRQVRLVRDKAVHKGKQLIPTQNGAALISVLPDMLTSPQLTAEWENNLTQIAKGAADPGEFLSGIEAMARELVQTHAAALDGKKDLFREEKPSVGKCPRCGSPVHEGKKNYYCSNKECAFVMWKNDRFFEERKTAFSAKIAAALLKSGKVNVKKLYSPKTGKTYDGTIVLADTGGKYVNYRIEVQKN